MGNQTNLKVYKIIILSLLSIFLILPLWAGNNQTCVTSLAITLQINEIKIKNNRDDDGNGEFHFWRKLNDQNVRLPQQGEIKRSKGEFILPTDQQYSQESFWTVHWQENGTSERLVQFDAYEDDEWSDDDYMGQVETAINFSTFEFVTIYKNFKLETGDYHLVFSLFCAPIIASSTHADSSITYSTKSLNISWSPLMSAQGVLGYSYELFDSPLQQPDDLLEGTYTMISYHQLAPGTYWFAIKAQDKAGFWSDTGRFKVNIKAVTSVPEFTKEADSFQFHPPFPNPFNSATQFSYYLNESSPVILKVYNLKGELIRTLVDCNQLAGQYQIQWDGKNETGQDTATGLYFAVLKHDNGIEHYKLTLIR
ncbi:T9SS type A sorting domain-containing protein [candidate division KSB1 bacterium]|nr:T9SS type A sorting domain-containing protein [candidate division KSB1 bacterium]